MKAFTRTRMWFVLFVLIVFGSGLGTGLLLSRFGPRGPWAAPRPSWPAAVTNRLRGAGRTRSRS